MKSIITSLVLALVMSMAGDLHAQRTPVRNLLRAVFGGGGRAATHMHSHSVNHTSACLARQADRHSINCLRGQQLRVQAATKAAQEAAELQQISLPATCPNCGKTSAVTIPTSSPMPSSWANSLPFPDVGTTPITIYQPAVYQPASSAVYYRSS